MTGDFNIKSIAIIGGGYSGLSTLADLLHTSAEGVSTISKAERPLNPAFTTIKLFEQTQRVGGAWNYSKVTDPDFPSQEVLEKKQYWEPKDIINQKTSENDIVKGDEYIWANSAVYDHLHTNISSDFMTLSTLPKRDYPQREFSPFITHKEVLRILLDFIEKYQLDEYINYNSSVKNVIKDSNGKYQLTIRELNPLTGEEKWSIETFDAIVVASGRFQYPHIPKIPHLAEYNAKYPGAVSHAKSFRRASDFAGQKIVIVGASVSSIGLLEYVKPIAKEVFIARRTFRKPVSKALKHFDKAFNEDGVTQVGEIVDIDVETNTVTFKTGETVSDVDKIVLATGYHIHYPFFEELQKTNDNIVQVDKYNGDQRTFVKNLFHFIFTIGEPTIAHVGVPSSPFFVPAAETQGAVVAGVWSNARQLPDLQAQNEWFVNRLEETKGQRLTHQYEARTMKPEIEYLSANFLPIDRPSPISRVDIDLYEEQSTIWEDIYDKFASGRLPEDYVLKHDISGL